MNPVVSSAATGTNPYVYKDAVFISTHKVGPGHALLTAADRYYPLLNAARRYSPEPTPP